MSLNILDLPNLPPTLSADELRYAADASSKDLYRAMDALGLRPLEPPEDRGRGKRLTFSLASALAFLVAMEAKRAGIPLSAIALVVSSIASGDAGRFADAYLASTSDREARSANWRLLPPGSSLDGTYRVARVRVLLQDAQRRLSAAVPAILAARLRSRKNGPPGDPRKPRHASPAPIEKGADR